MSNIKKQNDMRVNLSSFSNIFQLKKYIKLNQNLNISDKCILNNNKIININNFEFEINNKKIKYSTYYTNPFNVKSNILTNIKFEKTKNDTIKNLCNKIFLSSDIVILEDRDSIELELNLITMKKNKFINKYIGFEHGMLILWYVIYTNDHINPNDKIMYFDLIKYYYIQFILNEFDFSQIIYNMLNTNDIRIKKFYTSFYVFTEEFHYKYINMYLEQKKNSNIFFNSNYTKINPIHILNNVNGECAYDIGLINEDIKNPFGHNILLIKSNNKIYYYDPDEQDFTDIYKFKILFKSSDINFFNISNRVPIQTITDDSNCVFYCLGLIKYILEHDIKFELNKLKNCILYYETFLLTNKINIYKWSVC